RDHLCDPDRRRRRDRNGVQHPGARPSHHFGGAQAGLPGDPGRRAPDRRDVHDREPAGRSRVPRHRPTYSVPVSDAMSHVADAASERALVDTSPREGQWLWLRALVRRKIALVGAVLVAVNLIVALLAGAIGRVDPQRLDVKARLAAPSAVHWFGTDDVGRDV